MSVYTSIKAEIEEAKHEDRLLRAIVVDKKRLAAQYRGFCSLAKDRWFHAEVYRNSNFRWGGKGRQRCK